MGAPYPRFYREADRFVAGELFPGWYEIEFSDTGLNLLHHIQAHAIRYVSGDRMDEVAITSLIADVLYSAECSTRKQDIPAEPYDDALPYWGA